MKLSYLTAILLSFFVSNLYANTPDEASFSYHYQLNNGEQVALVTNSQIYQKSSGNISRMELIKNRFIHFQIKNNHSEEKLKITISYSNTGLDNEDFKYFRSIEADENFEGVQTFLIIPNFHADGNVFLKWEIENAKFISNDGKTNHAYHDYEYLTYDLIHFYEFEKLFNGKSKNVIFDTGNKKTEIYIEEVNLLAQNHKIITFDGENKKEVTIDHLPKTFTGDLRKSTSTF